jgi:cell shape-determining protein MreD
MKPKWVVLIMSLLLVSAGAWAQQSTGTITGVVYDS